MIKSIRMDWARLVTLMRDDICECVFMCVYAPAHAHGILSGRRCAKILKAAVLIPGGDFFIDQIAVVALCP